MSPLAIVLCICALVPQLTFSANTLKNLKEINVPHSIKTRAVNRSIKNLSDIGSFNDYVDSILADMKTHSVTNGLDPVELEDVTEQFEWKILLITYTGKLSLTNGWMQGLSSIYRTGDVVITLSDKGVNIAVPVSMEYLLMDYKYHASLVGIKYDGFVDARITDIDFILNLGINSVTNDLSLNNIDIRNTGNIKLKLTGNALTDWMVNLFSGIITRIFRGLIENVLSGNFSEIFVKVLDIINKNK